MAHQALSRQADIYDPREDFDAKILLQIIQPWSGEVADVQQLQAIERNAA